MPKVLNMYHTGKKVPEGAVYIGRPTKWGNPFEIGKDGTREEVIAKYLDWIMKQPTLMEDAKKELCGKDLVCWCAPRACHGDVLMMIANTEYLRNIPYVQPKSTRPSKLVASAVIKDDHVWTGLRHFTCIHQAAEDTGKTIYPEDQGFWTDDNRFVSRKAAEMIAIRAGQLSPEHKGVLLSEHLW